MTGLVPSSPRLLLPVRYEGLNRTQELGAQIANFEFQRRPGAGLVAGRQLPKARSGSLGAPAPHCEQTDSAGKHRHTAETAEDGHEQLIAPVVEPDAHGSDQQAGTNHNEVADYVAGCGPFGAVGCRHREDCTASAAAGSHSATLERPGEGHEAAVRPATAGLGVAPNSHINLWGGNRAAAGLPGWPPRPASRPGPRPVPHRQGASSSEHPSSSTSATTYGTSSRYSGGARW